MTVIHTLPRALTHLLLGIWFNLGMILGIVTVPTISALLLVHSIRTDPNAPLQALPLVVLTYLFALTLHTGHSVDSRREAIRYNAAQPTWMPHEKVKSHRGLMALWAITLVGLAVLAIRMVG